MFIREYDTLTRQIYVCEVCGNRMDMLFADKSLIEYHIPRQVTYHWTWRMYEWQDELKALYAHPESEKYETFDGALYNKCTKELLYVPRGKTSLHIPKCMRAIGYEALDNRTLDAITVDPENEKFESIDGVLVDKKTMHVHYVPPRKTFLHIAKHVKTIQYTAFDACLLEHIEVEEGNETYKSFDGALYSKDLKTLLYVPPKKTTLHIPRQTESIAIKALERIMLERVTLESGNPHLQFVDEILCDSMVQTLLYAPPQLDVLSVAASVRYIDSAVFLRSYRKLVVSAENKVFREENGTLLQGDYIAYVCPNVTRIHIPKGEKKHFVYNMDRLSNLKEITVSEENPELKIIDGILYDKLSMRPVYIPAFAQRLILPDCCAKLGWHYPMEVRHLKEISVSIHTDFEASLFEKLHKDCKIFIRTDDPITIELPHTTLNVLKQCLRFLKGADAEVKTGTERFYLDYFLLKKHCSENFYRVIKVSSWQIIKCIIEENDTARMKIMLNDGRLLTRRNINKAIHLALSCGNMDMHDLLSVHKGKK